VPNWISYEGVEIEESDSFEAAQWLYLVRDGIPDLLGTPCENTPEDFKSVIGDAPEEKRLSLLKAMACKDCIRRLVSRYRHLLTLKSGQYDELLANYAERGAYIKKFNRRVWNKTAGNYPGVENPEPEAGAMAADPSDEKLLGHMKTENAAMIARVVAQLDREAEARDKKEEIREPSLEGASADEEADQAVEPGRDSGGEDVVLPDVGGDRADPDDSEIPPEVGERDHN